MKSDRLYYSVAAALFLWLTVTGFFAFYAEGKGWH